MRLAHLRCLLLTVLVLYLTGTCEAKRRPAAQKGSPGDAALRTPQTYPTPQNFRQPQQFQPNQYQQAQFQNQLQYQMQPNMYQTPAQFQMNPYQSQYPNAPGYFVPQVQQPSRRTKAKQSPSPYVLPQQPMYPPIASAMYPPMVSNKQVSSSARKGAGKSRSAKKRARRRAKKQAARRAGPTLRSVIGNQRLSSSQAMSGDRLIADLRSRVKEAQKKLEDAYQLLNGLVQQIGLLTEASQVSATSNITSASQVNDSQGAALSDTKTNEHRLVMIPELDESNKDSASPTLKLSEDEDDEESGDSDQAANELAEEQEEETNELEIPGKSSMGESSADGDEGKDDSTLSDVNKSVSALKPVQAVETQIEAPKTDETSKLPVESQKAESHEAKTETTPEVAAIKSSTGASIKPVVEVAGAKSEPKDEKTLSSPAPASAGATNEAPMQKTDSATRSEASGTVVAASSSSANDVLSSSQQVASAAPSMVSNAPVPSNKPVNPPSPPVQPATPPSGQVPQAGTEKSNAEPARPPVFTFSASSSSSSTSGSANRQSSSSFKRNVRRSWNRARLLAQKNSLLNGALLKGSHHVAPYLQSARNQVRETAELVSPSSPQPVSSPNFGPIPPLPPIPPIPPIPQMPSMPPMAPLPLMARGELGADKRRRLSDATESSHFESSHSDSGPVISVSPDGTTLHQQQQQQSSLSQQTSGSSSGASLKRSNSSVFSSVSQSSSSSHSPSDSAI